MFPVRDDNPALHPAYAMYAIVALNALAWVFLQGMGSEPALVRSVCELGAVPGELLGTVRAGTEVPVGPDSVCVVEGTARWVTAVTHMFLHGSWLHILGNMWFLWLFGDNVEDSMGHFRFAVFYLLCGLAAFAAQMAAAPNSAIPMVGASGAIGGVMGAYAIMYPRARVHMVLFLGFYVSRAVVPAALMLGYWFVLQILGGSVGNVEEGGGVAFWAHVGGFAAGLVLSYLFRDSERVEAHRRQIASSWGARYA
jgi:membrane associated rhomboid family serine protease